MSKIVKRTLDFIELFADHKRPLSLSEISKYLKIPISSCHDVLQSLQERGYLYELGPRAGFYPTLRLQQLANRIAEHDPITLRAEIQLRELRDTFDESISLARAHGESAIYLLVFEPSQPLRFLVRVGDNTRSLYATSAGKAVLGSMSEAQREAVLERLILEPLTEKTISSKDALRLEIKRSMERGWYLNREESVPTATTVSASFVWNRSTYIVTIAGPTFRMDPKLDALVEALKKACARLESPESEPPPSKGSHSKGNAIARNEHA
jgi:DNA-binding IclR family transcriptional regulator